MALILVSERDCFAHLPAAFASPSLRALAASRKIPRAVSFARRATSPVSSTLHRRPSKTSHARHAAVVVYEPLGVALVSKGIAIIAGV
jgi:acyl-CoA reductase-like NAD-dependent aldehyde dehydrogenase